MVESSENAINPMAFPTTVWPRDRAPSVTQGLRRQTMTAPSEGCSSVLPNNFSINQDSDSEKTLALEDDNKYKIPKPKDDPWQVCLDLFLEEDKAKYQAWNDEVETLLIFAGLFSAVVTAFVVQSYQNLTPNPADQVTLLLGILISNINSSLVTNPAVANSMASQEPSSSAIRVNILWFLSLVLSLSTVLVGIVALQWIREYQHYSGISSTKRKLALRNMRAEGLERWLVPEILAGLPLLLQTALILFFAGIIDFLINLKLVVAIPVIVVIALTLFFILVTIILPAAQCFWTVNTRISSKKRDLPAQCPYKSAQSWIFFRIISSKLLHNIFAILLFPFTFVVYLAVPFYMPLYTSGFASEWLHAAVAFLTNFLESIEITQIRSWADFDRIYLTKRQQIISQTQEPLRTKTPINSEGFTECDVSRSIARAVNEYGYDNSIVFAAYHCFRDLPSSVLTEEFFALMSTEKSSVSPTQHSLRISDLLPPNKETRTSLQRHENEVLFFEQLPRALASDFLPVLRNRQLELFIRMTEHIFTSGTYMDQFDADGTRITLSSPLHRAFHGKLYIPKILRNVANTQLIPDEIAKDVYMQLCVIFRSFVLTTINSHGRELSAFCHREDLITDYMQLMHTITLDALSRDYPFLSSDGRQPSFFQHITATLTLLSNHIHPSMPPTMKLLFYSGILYACHFQPDELARLGRRIPAFLASLRTLVRCLRNYELSQMGRLKFLVRNEYYLAQWEIITTNVLSDSVENDNFTSEDIAHARNQPGTEDQVQINIEEPPTPSTWDRFSIQNVSVKGYITSPRNRAESSSSFTRASDDNV